MPDFYVDHTGHPRAVTQMTNEELCQAAANLLYRYAQRQDTNGPAKIAKALADQCLPGQADIVEHYAPCPI